MSDCFDHAADAYDDLCFGQTSQEGFSVGYGTPLGKTCKFCGMQNLHWHTVSEKWKLCVNGEPHKCVRKE
jgi:hypothetical protein